MSEYTKCPWIAEGIHVKGPLQYHTSVGTGETVTYRHGFAIGGQWGSIEQRRVDAKLMAAAPEMYEALKAVLDKGCALDLWPQVKAAIAKAEGK